MTTWRSLVHLRPRTEETDAEDSWDNEGGALDPIDPICRFTYLSKEEDER